MALDGMFLYLLKEEIKKDWLGSRVEKIHQPSKNELVISLRGFGRNGKLLFSASGDAPRVHFTKYSPENPQTPPTFCMLARKHLTGAKLVDVDTLGLERVMTFLFEAQNELMDKVLISLKIEIMSRHSNIILINENGNIIDAIKRIDENTSSVRLVLPGIKYSLPPKQDKLDISECGADEVLERLRQYEDLPLSKALSKVLLGVSPLVCRELALGIDGDGIDGDGVTEALKKRINALSETLKSRECFPVMLRQSGAPFEFCFTEIKQYGDTVSVQKYDSLSELADDFYFEKSNSERNRQRGNDLIKLVKNLIERIAKKINLQKIDLEKCAGKEKLRVYGELINANLYALSDGSAFYEIQNYYEDGCPTVRIKSDPLLTPVQNAQKYFKDYKKACTAQTVLAEQIESGAEELSYLESVLDELQRAESDRELAEIRDELKSQGYIKDRKAKGKPPKALPALRYLSSDGFTILVGRNNVQNDQLTLKTAAKNDLWLHTKDIHGSHTIIVTDGRDVPENTVIEAAKLAAYHSSAKLSSSVPVDLTFVRFVKKPPKSKPGSVIYTNQRTVFVTPSKEFEDSLRIK